jgi:membrane protease YdiL (CAAX protease family)
MAMTPGRLVTDPDHPPPSAGPSAARDGAAVLLAASFPTLSAWLYFVALAADPAAGVNRPMQAAYFGGKLVQFGLPVLYLLLYDPAALRGFSLRPRGLAAGVAFGLAVAAATLALSEALLAAGLLSGLPDALRGKVGQLGLLSPAGFAALAAFLALAHSGLEEAYWRGFVHGRLRRLVPPVPAAALSSLGFMAHHVVLLAVYLPGRFWAVAVPLSLCVAVGGAFWAWLYDRTGSLAGPWASHALVDAVLMAVGYRLIFG